MASGVGEFLSKKTADLPNWAWLLVIVVGGGVGYYFIRQQQSQPSAATTSAPGSSASTNAQNANPTDTGTYTVEEPPASPDYSSTGIPSSPVYVVTGPPTTTTGGTQPPSTPPPTTTLTIRGKETGNGQFAAYDANHSGVPLRSSPSGGAAVLAEIPYGAQVQEIGGPVSGQSNTTSGVNTGASTLWYQVRYNGQTGYVSIEDIVGAGAGGHVRADRRIGG